MSKLIIMAGTKGGVGKSLAATFFADFAEEFGYCPILFDCDNENRSLCNAYKGAAAISVAAVDIDSRRGEMDYPLDDIINRIEKKECENSFENRKNLYILDMKAGTSCSTLEWLEAFPFERMKELSVGVFIVGCLTSDIDSGMTWAVWVKKYSELAIDEKLRFVIIKNEVAGDNFTFYDKIMKGFLEEQLHSTIIINLPVLSTRHLNRIKDFETSYGQVAKSRIQVSSFGFMDIHRIRMMYGNLKRAFAGFFTDSVSDAQQEITHGGEHTS